MTEIIVVPVVFITAYMVIELFVHRKERLTLIEKASENQTLDLSGVLKSSSAGFSISALKIGSLFCGLGLGFLLSFILRLTLRDCIQGDWNLIEMLNIASVLTFGGLGLIIAYIIEKPKK